MTKGKLYRVYWYNRAESALFSEYSLIILNGQNHEEAPNPSYCQNP
nr:MAG TPA: hypothetical protein [Caudoviricetes sp.]